MPYKSKINMCYDLCTYMTYAMAWKTKDSVFLAADTAITTRSNEPLKLHRKESSFGQENFLDEDEGRMVEESVVKLFLKNNIGVTFAGNYPIAIKVTTDFYRKIAENMKPLEALKQALFLHPIPSDKNLAFVVGYYENEPKILYFDSRLGSVVDEDSEVVQIGNPLEVHKNLTLEWIKDIGSVQSDSELHLVSMLGVFQSYNLFSPQMSRGIGGAFCGLYINKESGFWQPDILYMDYGVLDGKLVSTAFRHNCLVINSPTLGQSRCLVSHTLDMTQQQAYDQGQKAIEKGKKFQRNAQFEYIVLVHVQNVTLTVVKMQRENKHEFIWIQHIKDDQGEGAKIALFPEMRAIANRPKEKGGLVIIPYRKPRKGQVIPAKHI